MDELEISKIFGAGCAALLAFVGFGQLGSALVSVDQLDEPAYVIEVADVDTDDGDTVVKMPIGQLMAMAEIDHGAKVFKKCSACHKVEDGAAHGVGPNLYGIVGREIAGVDGYDFSEALTSKDGPWDFAALDGFLEAPKKWANGTKMGFAGLSKEKDRASVIAWLNEQSASPMPMPMPVVEDALAAADDVAEEKVAVVVVEETKPEVALAVPAPVSEAAEVDDGKDVEVAVVEPAKVAPVEKIDSLSDDFDPAVVALMAGADMEKGAKVFRKCKACHRAEKDGGNGVGPNLYGMVGRDIASVNGFDYSDALLGKEGVWDVAALDAFLLKPKEWAKGTKMAFAGLRKDADRAAIIAWLNAQSDLPIPLPE